MATDRSRLPWTAARLDTAIRVLVVTLVALLGLSLLVVGTIAIIAELKGTWHWSIHLETTLRYTATFVKWLLAFFVPAIGTLLVGRRVIGDA